MITTWWFLPTLLALVGGVLLLVIGRPESREPHEHLLIGLIGVGLVGVLIQMGIDSLPPDRRAELEDAARALESRNFPIDDAFARLQLVRNAVGTHLSDGWSMAVREDVSDAGTLQYTIEETPGVAQPRFCIEVTVTEMLGGQPQIHDYRLPSGETGTYTLPAPRRAWIAVAASPSACTTGMVI